MADSTSLPCFRARVAAAWPSPRHALLPCPRGTTASRRIHRADVPTWAPQRRVRSEGRIGNLAGRLLGEASRGGRHAPLLLSGRCEAACPRHAVGRARSPEQEGGICRNGDRWLVSTKHWGGIPVARWGALRVRECMRREGFRGVSGSLATGRLKMPEEEAGVGGGGGTGQRRPGSMGKPRSPAFRGEPWEERPDGVQPPLTQHSA